MAAAVLGGAALNPCASSSRTTNDRCRLSYPISLHGSRLASGWPVSNLFASTTHASRKLHKPRIFLPHLVTSMEDVEESYIMIKPDGVQRGLVGEIISMFEKKGFKLKGLKHFKCSKELAQEHYKDLQSKPLFPKLINYITSGPVVRMVWEGVGVVASVCKLIGVTNPLNAEPGTIRGGLAVQTGRNVVHGSETSENGKGEINSWIRYGDFANIIVDSPQMSAKCIPTGPYGHGQLRRSIAFAVRSELEPSTSTSSCRGLLVQQCMDVDTKQGKKLQSIVSMLSVPIELSPYRVLIFTADRPGRRQLLSTGATIVPWFFFSQPALTALAAETKKGFLLVTDKKDGYTFLYPFGWQEVVVEGQDKVFKDVIEPLESVSVNVIPTGKQDIRDFGPPQEVAATLIKKVLASPSQKTKLIEAAEHDVDGKAYYTFEFIAQAPNYTRHALSAICIGNGKFYTLTTGANERRWEKMKDRLKTVVESFQVFNV